MLDAVRDDAELNDQQQKRDALQQPGETTVYRGASAAVSVKIGRHSSLGSR